MAAIMASCACAGPPFITDDPEPVELHHWEVYVSSLTLSNPFQSTGTMPHVEVNNGAAPNLQLHIILPYFFSRPAGEPTSWGLGDTELGVKYRFVQETKTRPMVGTFPLIEVPTGDADAFQAEFLFIVAFEDRLDLQCVLDFRVEVGGDDFPAARRSATSRSSASIPRRSSPPTRSLPTIQAKVRIQPRRP